MIFKKLLLFALLTFDNQKVLACNFLDKIGFIKDFFEEKNIQITAYVCWNRGHVRTLQKVVWNLEKPKFLVVHNNSTNYEGFLNAGRTSNFFLVDLVNCPKVYNLFLKANESDSFNFPHKWLILTTEDEYNELLTKLNHYSLLPSSEFVIATCKNNKFILSQPYRTKMENVLIWENYGMWNKTHKLTEYLKYPVTSERRHNLQRARLKIGMHLDDNDTLNHLEDFKYPQIDTFTKQDWGSVKCLLDYSNIDYITVIHDSYGYYNAVTKTWDGMVYHLANKKNDFSASAMYFTMERYEIVDYLKMINPLEIRFILREPPISYISNIFGIAFKFSVWMSMIVVLVFFSFALYIILNIEARRKMINFKNKFTKSDITLILLEAVCQQGTVTEPRTISGRLIALILFMAFMFIYVAYSAYIVVLLQSTKPIKNLKELADSRIAVGAHNVTYTYYYFLNLKDPVHIQIYQTKISPNEYYNLNDGVERVRKGFFAFHIRLGSAYDLILKRFSDYEICGLQELPGFYEENKGYLPIQKNSSYKEILKVGLFKIDEYGLQRRTNRRFFLVPKCYQKGANFESVGIIDCYQAILILFIGTVIAFLIFLFEKIYYSFKQKISII